MKLIILLGLFLVILNVKTEDDYDDYLNDDVGNKSEHPPVFSKHLYIATYSWENTLKMEETMTIKYGAQKNMAVQQYGYEKYFKIIQNPSTKEELDVQIIEPLTEDILKEDFIIIDVEVKNEGSSYSGLTTLLIDLPNEKNTSTDIHPPVFSKHLYIANYSSDNTLEMEEKMTIKYGAQENMAVQQYGYEKYFKIIQNPSTKEGLDVQIIEPLTEDILKEDFIIIDVEVKNEGSSYSGLTTLLIDLPNEKNTSTDIHPPVFSKHLYIANYSSDNTLEMEEKMTIKYGAQENMAVQQYGYEKYFKIIQNPSVTEELDVQIIEPLTEEILKENYIIIDLEVKNEGSSYSGLTTLLIHLSNDENTSTDVHPPVFSKHLYIANYSSDNTLKMDEKMTIKYGAQENMAVQQYGYEKYFKIIQNPSTKEELAVQIIEPLTEDILKEDYIIIDVEVKNEGSSYSGLTTLLIDLPNEKNTSTDIHPPVFSKHLYIANYSSDNTLKMEEKMTIKYGAQENMAVQQYGYEKYFKIIQNPSVTEELDVQIIEPLTEEILKENYIIIDLEVKNEGSSYSGLTTLLIHLSNDENTSTDVHPPVFSKHLYIANYSSDNTLKMDEKMTIKYGAQENMAVQQYGYEKYFKIIQNPSTKEELAVQIIEPLTEDILKEDYIIIDVEVKNEGSSYSGLTTLLIDLPNEKNTSTDIHPPVFSKHLYIANYSSDNTLKMEEKMTIKYGAQENMAVQQYGYEKYFKIIQNPSVKEELDVQIIEPLTEEILKENYIVIDLEVKNEGSSYSGLTTLLIHLPNDENTSTAIHPPVFSKSAYFANYTTAHELKLEETITIKYGATNNTFVKQSNYEEYIKISLSVLNKTELQVEIIKPLDNETLENDLIVIEITAENVGLSIPTRSNLIIQLQKEVNESPNCVGVVHIFGFTVGDTIFPLVLFLSAITIIVFVNIVVLSLYFKKNRANSLTTASSPT